MIAALFIAVSVLLASTALAQVEVDAALDGQRLDGQTRYLDDPTGQLTLAQVRQRAADFEMPAAAGLNLGLRRSGAMWVRIRVRNRAAHTHDWLLEVGNPQLDQLTVFETDGSAVAQREAGDLLPFSLRERQHHMFVFAFSEPPRSQREIYVRAETQGVLFLPLHAWTEHRYTEHAYLAATILFGFYGVVLVMAAYNLFLFALSRLPEYGLFALVVCAEGLTQLATYGHAAEWLFPDQATLAQRLVPFSLNFSVFANCLFGRHSVTVGRLPNWIRRTVDVLVPVTALCTVLVLIVPFSVLAVLVGFCYLGLVPFAAAVAINWRLQRGEARAIVVNGWATSMLLGWLCVVIGVAVTGLSLNGHLPSNAFTIHGFMFGASTQFVLITAGLSNRLGWLQTELVKVNGQLQGKIVELNSAIDLTQTETARAAAAARAKGEVVATMTHELRTPLNAIINIPQGLQQDFSDISCLRCTACDTSFAAEEGEELNLVAPCPSCGKTNTFVLAQLAEYVGDPERSFRYLAIVEKAGQHLLRVVERILDPATESCDLQIVNIDALPLLTEVADQMNTVAAQAGVELRLDAAVSFPWLAADPLRLRQILINLIGNAIKFSDGKGVVIVRVRVEEKSVVFSVQDEGIGIADDKRAGIFESFEQAHDPALRRFGGTGLGLSIVRSLVRLHGGEVWLESKLGQGSTFYFSIPCMIDGVRPLAARTR